MSVEELRFRLMQRLHYDPLTGDFIWRVDACIQRPAGSIAGCTTNEGYRSIRVLGKDYRSNRLAWLFEHGRWPTRFIDHINGDRADNRLSNLREANDQINQQNRRNAGVKSKTGILGVIKAKGKFRAQINYQGKTKHIGTFETAEEASEAYIRAKRQLHNGCTI